MYYLWRMRSYDVSCDSAKLGLPIRQAEFLKTGYVSASTLHRWKRQGLATYRVGGTAFLDLDDIRSFVKKGGVVKMDVSPGEEVDDASS